MKRNKRGYSNTITVQLDVAADLLIDLEVYFEISEYVPEKMYLANGNPGYPAEGGEIEEQTITFRGKDFSPYLNQKELDYINEQCYADQIKNA